MFEKVFVIGASGFLGNNILKRNNKFEINGSYLGNSLDSNSIQLDLYDHANVKKILISKKPTIIVDASYFSPIIKTDEALETNRSNMLNLISICKEINAKLLFISSDAVFDGITGNYAEKDIPHPNTLYGKIKYESEKLIINNLENYLIARTSLLFGNNVNKWSFVMWVINKVQSKEFIEVIMDQYVSPSYCENVADMILDAMALNLQGLIHVSGSTQITRFDFAKLICKTYSLDDNFLIPIKLDEVHQIEKRGENTTLNVDKATQILRIKPISAEEGLMKMKNQMIKKL